MGTKKTNSITEQKQIEIPKDITQCTFWKRLPYQLEEEQWDYIKAIWDKKNLMVMVDACAISSIPEFCLANSQSSKVFMTELSII